MPELTRTHARLIEGHAAVPASAELGALGPVAVRMTA